jgi:gluconokinase
MATRRGHFMPGSLIDSQLNTLEDLRADEPGSTFPTDGSAGQVADAILARLRNDGRI